MFCLKDPTEPDGKIVISSNFLSFSKFLNVFIYLFIKFIEHRKLQGNEFPLSQSEKIKQKKVLCHLIKN